MANEAPDIQEQSPVGTAPAAAPTFGAATPAGPTVPATPYSSFSGGATDQLPTTPGLDVDEQAVGFLSYLKQEQAELKKKQAARNAPGGFADRLKTALGQFDASFGDTAHAAEGLVPGESGAGHGVAMTMEARTKRLAGEREEARRDEELRQRNAMNNIEMAVHVQQIMKDNDQMRQGVLDSNKAFSKAREDAGWNVEHGVTEIDARDRISKTLPNGHHYTDDFDFVPVSTTEINGKKVPVYDVISKQDKNVDVDDTTAEYIKKNGGPDLKGTKDVPYVSLRALQLEASRKDANTRLIEDALGKELDSKQKLAMGKALASPDIQVALRKNPAADAITNLMSTLNALDGGAFMNGLRGAPTDLEHSGAIGKETIMLQHAQAALAQAQKSGNPQMVQKAQAAVKEVQDVLDKYKKVHDDAQTVLTSLNLDKDAVREHEEYQRELEKQRRDDLQAQRQKAKDAQDKALEKKQSQGQTVVTKVDDTYTKSAKGLQGAYADILRAQDNDQLANSMGSLFVALGVAESNDIRRINQNEIQQAGPEVGSWMRKAQGFFAKAKDGKLPADTLKEMQDMIKSLQDISYRAYVDQQLRNQHNYQLDDDVEISGPNGRGSISLGDARAKYSGGGSTETKLPTPPTKDKVAVQIPGSPAGFISRAALPKFKKDHPNAQIGE